MPVSGMQLPVLPVYVMLLCRLLHVHDDRNQAVASGVVNRKAVLHFLKNGRTDIGMISLKVRHGWRSCVVTSILL